MDWSPIWSAAVAAGIVSAVANGLFALWRHSAEAKARRQETQHVHLRDAAVDFIAARGAVVAHRILVFERTEEFKSYQRRAGTWDAPGVEERRQLRLEALRAQTEAEQQARNAMARLRLISQDVYELADAVLNPAMTPDQDTREAKDEADRLALEMFVDAVRTKLDHRPQNSRSAQMAT